MKRVMIVAILAVAANGDVRAQSAIGTGVGIANSKSKSEAVAISGQGGQGGNSSLVVNNPANTTNTSTSTATVNQNVSGTTTSNVNSRVSGTTTVRSAPPIAAPGLAAAGLETCLGSASGGLSAIGFGLTGGSTYPDEGCQARLDSRTLFAYGLKAAAVARLCQRADIWRAMPVECERYWPRGVPYPNGIAVAVVAPAPVVGGAVVMSTRSAVRVIDGRDGVEKDCLDYNSKALRCLQWNGEPRKMRLAPKRKPPLPAVITQGPKPAPSPAPAPAPAPAPDPN